MYPTLTLNRPHKTSYNVEKLCMKMYFVTKNFLTFREKKCSSDQETLLKFEVESLEFANFLRSLGQFFQTVKGQDNF